MSFFSKKHNSLKASKEDICSLPTATFNSVLQRYKFSDFLCYSVWDKDKNIYHNNDNTFGAVIECSTRIKSGGDTALGIQSIIEKLPDGVYLQFSILGLKNISNMVEFWRESHQIRTHTDQDEYAQVIHESVDAMCDFYYKKTQESIAPAMPSTIKHYVLLVSIKGEKRSLVEQSAQDTFNILNSNGFNPEYLPASRLHYYLYELLNSQHDLRQTPAYNESKYINRQLIMPSTAIEIRDDHMKIDGANVITLAPVSFPEEAHISDFGEKLGNSIGHAVNENQFNDNFIVTATISTLPEQKTKMAKNSHSIILSQNWSETLFRRFNAVKKESEGILERIDKNKERLFAFDLNVVVYGKDLEKTKENIEIIKKFWSIGGSPISLDVCKGIHQLNFIASLPMGINDEYMHQTVAKYHTFFPNQITQFIPLEGDWGGNTPNLLMTSRRGNLAGLDLFESPINFNGYIVATSGAGKSVLLNMLVFSSYARGDRVFILDYDNSFTKLTEVLGGQYVALELERPISFNPFTSIANEEALMDDLTYISSLIYMLGSSKSIEKSLEDEKFLQASIQTAIEDCYRDFGSNTEITHIKERLETNNINDDMRISDFATSLKQFCRGGTYEKFFAGQCEFDIKKELISVEFKGIENHPDLRDPLIMLLTYHIGQMMYQQTNRKNKIQIVFDEAHRFLGKNHNMDDFIDQAYRRARKYGGSIIMATQGFGDIYSEGGGLSPAGRTIIANSSWKIFMKQTEASVSMLKNSKLFELNPIDEEILRSAKTHKGSYSEMMVMTPHELKVPLRLVMNKFFYYLTTTDANDKAKIAALQEQGLTLVQAIRELERREA